MLNNRLHLKKERERARESERESCVIDEKQKEAEKGGVGTVGRGGGKSKKARFPQEVGR